MGLKYRIPVITGMCVVSPLGVGLATFWKALEDGASSVREISLFDATSYPCRIAAEVRAFSAEEFLSEKEMRTYPRQTQFALAGTAMALKDAGNPDLDLARTDVILGAAQISFDALETEIAEGQHSLQEYEPRLDPFGVLKTTMSIPASAVAFRFRTQGSAITLTSACTSGIDAIAMAANRIRNGEAEAVITGGTETPITRIVLNAFCAARMVTTVSNESPEAAMAPFDAKRTKSVLGEGAAILLLEEKQDALARGARIYCEVGRYGQEPENSNALFSVDRQGIAWKRMLRRVVGNKTSGIGAINAHAPSDRVVDRVESLVLQDVFGKSISRIPVASIKGATGSSMAAASAFQVVAGAMTIKTGVVPPTTNYFTPDPECELSVSHETRKPARKIRQVLINAHGVGGVNSALVLSESRS